MTVRHDIGPRHLDPGGPEFRQDLARLVESVQQALDAIPFVSFRWVRNFRAGAGGDALAPISWGSTVPRAVVGTREPHPPDVAMLVRTKTVSVGARDADNKPIEIGSRLDFDFNVDISGMQQVVLYQPDGMQAGETYDLLVMFVSGAEG